MRFSTFLKWTSEMDITATVPVKIEKLLRNLYITSFLTYICTFVFEAQRTNDALIVIFQAQLIRKVISFD